MERMIAYPVLMWGAGFGGYLIAYQQERTTQQKNPKEKVGNRFLEYDWRKDLANCTEEALSY
jgi:hypothetical protein